MRPVGIIAALAAGIAAAASMPALAVDPSRYSIPVEADTPPPTVFLQRLEQVEQELLRLGEPPALSMPRPAVLPYIDDARFFSTNVHDVTGVTYVSLRVVFYNQAEAPQELVTGKISLVVDGRVQLLEDNPTELRAHMVDAAGQPLSVADATPPPTVILPAGKTTTVQLVFLPVRSRAAPPLLSLRYETAGTSVELDLNRFHKGKLRLGMTRVGPGGACALATIGGTLDDINAADLASQIDDAVRQGVRRCVVAWPPGSPPEPPRLMAWLEYLGHSESPLYRDLPILASDLQTLQLVPPEGTAADNIDSGGVARFYPDVESAIEAALASVYPQQSRESVLKELRTGDPLARGAAVRYGGKRLLLSDLPMLAAYLDDPSAEVQASAALALADFDSPFARQELARRVRNGTASSSASAFEALAASRFAANAALAGELVDQAPAIPETQLIRVLGRHPQPAFRERVLQAARQGAPDTRIVALAAMSAFRDVPVSRLLSEALASSEAGVRDAALTVLVDSMDDANPQLRALAIAEAGRRLSLDITNPVARSVALRTRDPGLREILIARLNDSKEDRRELIDLVGQIGGSEALSSLEENYASFTPTERALALRHLWMLQSPHAQRYAAEGIESKKPDLIEQGVNILTHDASDASVKVLAAALRDSEQNDGYRFAEALSTIASPAAYDALIQLRDSTKTHAFAISALATLWNRSPAAEMVDAAHRLMELPSTENGEAPAGDTVAKAIELLNTALTLDPLLPYAYSHRGSAYLRRDDWEAASHDFMASLELNPDDHIALTGIAIAKVMRGHTEEALNWIAAGKPYFENNSVFLYNAACVYARAAERAMGEAGSADQDRRVASWRDEAFKFLGMAIAYDFEQPELMRSDRDLEALHGDPRFEEICRRAAGVESDAPP